MPRKIKLTGPSNDTEKMALFHEGDVIFTTKYGKCVIEFIDKKNLENMPGASVRDEDGKLHFVNVKEIIVED